MVNLSLMYHCALLEPALDEYWYTVKDLQCLMLQMPRELWDRKQNREHIKAAGDDAKDKVGSSSVLGPGPVRRLIMETEFFYRSPWKEDWDHFLSCSRRIRYLHVHCSSESAT
jgi:hypothetical protein